MSKKLKFEDLSDDEIIQYTKFVELYKNPSLGGDSRKVQKYSRKKNSLWRGLLSAGASIVYNSVKETFYDLKQQGYLEKIGVKSTGKNARYQYLDFFKNLLSKYQCEDVDWDTFHNLPHKIDFSKLNLDIKWVTDKNGNIDVNKSLDQLDWSEYIRELRKMDYNK